MIDDYLIGNHFTSPIVYVNNKNVILFPSEFVCQEGYIKCADGLQCISADMMCDGYAQCNDESDEDEQKCLSMFLGTAECWYHKKTFFS